ncbi:hypothetical protein L2E82_16942 [Cichorium intybus]|uniref:Uncharacterized protein n=1 Tax=Cichorium intybus TaxID=13427 RepID=A0ACB9F6X0_CICIN|nr:hypothetical protein L2E82_16942 [Cichorium intybus]
MKIMGREKEEKGSDDILRKKCGGLENRVYVKRKISETFWNKHIHENTQRFYYTHDIQFTEGGLNRNTKLSKRRT